MRPTRNGNVSGIELKDGSFHSPFIGYGRSFFFKIMEKGGFTWHCACGARGKRSYASRRTAVLKWHDHINRKEKKLNAI